jgi:glycosyltransferase involved in cell wall biosynthesis
MPFQNFLFDTMVSIIITAYNYGRYIERALRSCLDQSIPNSQYEIIIVNDCSTDNTVAILDNYQNDARIYHLEKNVGLSAARNFGVRKAKGQYVVFLDADDYLHRETIQVQKLFLEENHTLNAVAIDYFLVDDLENHRERIKAEEKPIACGIMFRKDLLIEIGLYDEKFKAREEEDLRIRFLERFNIYNIPLPLYRYRRHDNNLTNNEEIMQHAKKQLNQKHENI